MCRSPLRMPRRFTEAGYVGEDVENILLKLIQAADYDVEKAEKGIIYIDEIDKVARKSDNPSITRDVSGEGVQQDCLKFLKVRLPAFLHKAEESILIKSSSKLTQPTSCSFAAELLTESSRSSSAVSARRSSASALTTSMKTLKKKRLLSKVLPEDLLRFGLIPEFIGRLPIIASLEPLDKKALVEILTKPKNALVKQYKKNA